MNLHTNHQLFQDAVIATAQLFNIPEIYIEKDYWVTVALHAVFNSPAAEDTVFKGGTALSKCHKLINRFSEDVDLLVHAKNGESNSQLKNKLKAITDAVIKVMPEIEIVGVTNKRGMIRKTAHQYNKQQFNGSYGQVREQIIIEASWLGSSEPYIIAEISCYITDMMKATFQNKIIDQYMLMPFPVKVLSKERTLCEKIMSLVRFSFTEVPYEDLANKIRHIYDLHLLLKNEEVDGFFKCSDFQTLLLQVGKEDIISFKNNKGWLQNHPSTAIIFSSPEDTWNRISRTYRTSFKDLVIGDLPEESDLLNTLNNIYRRLEQIKWIL
jgi:Nucleotidyl transferase AbiEii toxin, Type IV TA system